MNTEELNDLQLDRAEFEQPATASACAGCGRPLAGSYWEVQGRTVCDACRQHLVERLSSRPGAVGFLRALGAGLAAAVVGAGIYYAVRELTGYQVGLVSILVGYLVGRAVHWGVQGRGGWLYQTLAMVLTYLAIVATYVPAFISAIERTEEEKAAVAAPATPPPAASPAPAAAPPAGLGAPAPPASGLAAPAAPAATPPVTVAPAASSPTAAKTAATPPAAAAAPGAGSRAAARSAVKPAPTADPDAPLTVGEALIGVGTLVLYLLALPIINTSSAVLGVVILGFGLYQAWKLNRRPRLSITGPHAIVPPGFAPRQYLPTATTPSAAVSESPPPPPIHPS